MWSRFWPLQRANGTFYGHTVVDQNKYGHLNLNMGVDFPLRRSLAPSWWSLYATVCACHLEGFRCLVDTELIWLLREVVASRPWHLDTFRT